MTVASCQTAPAGRVPAMVEQFKSGLAAPICLTWEWTYARGRAVSLGMPAVHVPARPCDSSPLAAVP